MPSNLCSSCSEITLQALLATSEGKSSKDPESKLNLYFRPELSSCALCNLVAKAAVHWHQGQRGEEIKPLEVLLYKTSERPSELSFYVFYTFNRCLCNFPIRIFADEGQLDCDDLLIKPTCSIKFLQVRRLREAYQGVVSEPQARSNPGQMTAERTTQSATMVSLGANLIQNPSFQNEFWM